DGVACSNCWGEIERKILTGDFCARCSAPLRPLAPRVGLPAEVADRRCGRCDHFAFDFVRSCGPYEGAMREAVLGLKWRPYVPDRLLDGLRRTFEALPESGLIESIIPAPLHPARLAERGFNQAEVIARKLVSLTGLRLNSTA